MNQFHSNYVVMMLFTLCFTFTLANSGCADAEDVINKSFNVASSGWLTVDSQRGSITVTTSTAEKVEVEVIRKVDGFSESEAQEILESFKIDFRHSGRDVTIEAEFDDRFSSWERRRNRLRVQYFITVPKKYNVDLNTAGGSISVDDLEGEAKSHTSGGSLKFGAIKGPVEGKTSGGSITLEGCVGDAILKTSGGSIRIGEVEGKVNAYTSGGSVSIESAQGSVDAKTSGGSIRVDEVMGTVNAKTSGGTINAKISRQPQADCTLKTSGGSVIVHMFDDIQVDVDARTSGGRVITDFPITVQGELKKSALEAKINGGGPLLYLRTSGGNIKLEKL